MQGADDKPGGAATAALAAVPVLVTGGGGFIGSHLVDALVAGGARVTVLDDFSSGARQSLASHGAAVQVIAGDVRDADACRRACRGARVVFHLAARGSVPGSLRDPAETIEVNVGGTSHLLAAARDEGVERVVYASSSSVYGDATTLPSREGAEGTPLSPYALSKQMSELLAATFARCFGTACVGLRYFNVYGPRQQPDGPYAAVVPRFLAAARAGEPLEIHGDGGQSRDFTYVGDAVAATLLAASAPAAACDHAYNVASGEATTIGELAAVVERLTGSAPARRYLPARQGDIRHSHADLTAARTRLGFHPAVELAEGLRRTLDALPPPRA